MSANEALLIADLNTVLVRKAIEDSAFRAQLLADPKATIEKTFQTSLPPGMTVKAVEASQKEYTIVLPYEAKTAAGGEMSDADLESVAGGSKSGAKSFFTGVGNTLHDVAKTTTSIGSQIGGAAGGAQGMAANIGCGMLGKAIH